MNFNKNYQEINMIEKVYENANEKIEAILFEIDINKDFREQFGEKYINHLQTK